MHTLETLSERIQRAAARHTPLCIRGGGTKDFYGLAAAGEILDTRGYAGIVAYEPTELYITARAGTPLADVEQAMDEHGQMLAFEPPHFANNNSRATVGGMVAAGLSGPRRMQAGAVRDFVLGTTIIDGHGKVLRFGGQVIKNVAGYDVSRLMAGSLGTLGLIAEVTLKVLPKPVAEASLRFDTSQERALQQLNQWGGKPLPISASAWHDGVLTIRLSGAAAAVDAARRKLGGKALAPPDATQFWQSLREQTHPFFAGPVTTPLWRLAVPPATPPLDLPGVQCIEWGGGLRWLRGDADPLTIRAAASTAGGHASLFRGTSDLKIAAGVFQPPPLWTLHRRIKDAFDPHRIFNPGRLYPGL